MDIDNLTDEQLDELIRSVELKCKIDPKTSVVTCPTTEDISKAIARLKNPVKRLVFDIEPEPAPEPAPEPEPVTK